MDTIRQLLEGSEEPIISIDMHTTGEPTRIIIKGYPVLSGSLLEQREQARLDHDHIRKRLMLEPVGHADMYGAILRPTTELTESGEAHIGVLFMHNEGYGMMCGHATIALGRLLVDTHNLDIFPKRNEILCDATAKVATINLHAPCGVVRITVPLAADLKHSDPSRPVSFISVPSFSVAQEIEVKIPADKRWPEMLDRDRVRISICFGGAFSCLVTVNELGFGGTGLRQPIDHEPLRQATRNLKAAISQQPQFQKYTKYPTAKDISPIYTVMVVDKSVGRKLPGSKGVETGLCYFAEQQVDRSPTGSVVAARIAHAYAIGDLEIGQSWTYHSLVSNAIDGKGGFLGTVVEEVPELFRTKFMLANPVRVKVEGFAYYTASHTLIAEREDPYRNGGFMFERL